MTQALDTLSEVSRITNAELVCRLEHLVKADRALSAKLLVHIGEVDARKLYCEHAYESMHRYCVDALRMSDAEAYLRMQAARLGRRFPLVLERLGAGDLNLSGIKLLDSHLTEENHVERLDRARGMTKRQIEVLVAEWAPKPDVPARIRKLPDVRAAATTPQSLFAPQVCGAAPTSIAGAPAISAPPSASISPSVPVALQVAPALPAIQIAPSQSFALQPVQARASRLTPLSPGRFSLALTLGQEDHDKLEQLREFLRHQNPSGDLGSIVARALRELHEREMKKRFAQVKVPKQVAREHARPGPNVNALGKDHAQSDANALGKHDAQSDANALGKHDAQGKANTQSDANALGEVDAQSKRNTQSKPNARKSRYIPQTVFREVFTRDGGQCTFVSPGGRRCTARGFLQVDHHSVTYARGGAATVGNLRIACRAHNLFLACQDYGRRFMQDKLREAVQRKRAGSSF